MVPRTIDGKLDQSGMGRSKRVYGERLASYALLRQVSRDAQSKPLISQMPLSHQRSFISCTMPLSHRSSALLRATSLSSPGSVKTRCDVGSVCIGERQGQKENFKASKSNQLMMKVDYLIIYVRSSSVTNRNIIPLLSLQLTPDAVVSPMNRPRNLIEQQLRPRFVERQTFK